jgi:uncharacterized membrane protein
VYDFLLTVHVLAAIVWLGGSIMLLVLGNLLRGAGIERRAEFTRLAEKVGNLVFAPASVVLIVAGTLLVDEVGYGYSDTWITLGYVGWFLSFLLGVAFYPREGKRREKLIESAGMGDPGVLKSVNRVLAVAAVDTLIITLVVVDMTTKPGV